MRRPTVTPPRVRRAALTLLTLLTLLTVPGLAACSHARVPTPPADATPTQVVQAYVQAVHAGDCTTASGLVEDGSSWCGSIDITDLAVTQVTQEPRATATGAGDPIQRVWVTFTTHGSDVSMPDGHHAWSYLLDHTGPGGAWRIVDQGMG